MATALTEMTPGTPRKFETKCVVATFQLAVEETHQPDAVPLHCHWGHLLLLLRATVNFKEELNGQPPFRILKSLTFPLLGNRT